MAVVWIPSLLRSVTGGKDTVKVPGGTVGQVIEALEKLHPGIRARLCEGDRLRAGIAVSVDTQIARRGLRQPVGPASEVHFVPAVSGGAPSKPRILMCPPDFYGIEYEINPWMSRSRGSVPEKAHGQWRNLFNTLVSLGVQVELLTPRQGLPDLVFTANAGLVFKDRFFSSRFRHGVRARETPYFEAWVAEHGFKVEHLPQDVFFEGAGDALFCGPTLFAGYRIRSDVGGHQYLGKVLHKLVLPLELVDPRFYHLDTCFCPLAPGQALYFPTAFDSYGRKVLASQIPTLIPVQEPEAIRFACNAVVVGNTVIHNSGCDRLAADLRKLGYECIALELDEFLKAGGSAKCLTLRLDGEEAAIWDD